MDERELISKAKDRNKHAMNILLQQNYKALYGFTLKMTSNQHQTEDIVQEVCLKAVINIKKFKGNSKFQTWLISMAVNYYKDLLRKDKRIEFIEDVKITSVYNNEKEILEKLQVEELLKELNKLPEDKRISFILKHYYGYKYEEIAEILNCSEGTIKSRIFYTVTNLKKKLVKSEVN